MPGERSAVSNADLLMREHRLYQTDFLMRKYGFQADEIGFDDAGNLPLDVDPKEYWARRHPERFPVDVNRADKAELLRVPGLGPVAVRRILNARKNGGRVRSFESLGLRGAQARKAAAWTTLEPAVSDAVRRGLCPPLAPPRFASATGDLFAR